MRRKGWIKLYRRELEWMNELSDREFRYFIVSRLNTPWDARGRHFGTFDARGEVVKMEMLPNWSLGKINGVKNSLIAKGIYKKERDRRLSMKNVDLFLEKTRKYESVIQDSERNLYKDENYLQKTEITNKYINDRRNEVAERLSQPWNKKVQDSESSD